MYYELTDKSLKQKQLLPPYLVETIIVLLLVLATLVINLRMIREGVNATVDIQAHISWLQHFSKEISEGIYYPRWLAGTNYGYGSPTFVFYPPLVYYLGSFLKIIGLNIEQTIISLFLLSFFGAGLSFYIFGRNRWGKTASFLAALAYMTAPYISINIYRRGALPENLAITLIPLGLWLTNKAILSPKWRVVLALFFSFLALTHVPSLLLCTIFWLGYILCFLGKRPWIDIFQTIGAALLGFGIVSAYLLPAISEKSLVNIEGMRNVAGGFSANFIKITSLMPGSPQVNIQFIFAFYWLTIIVLTIIAVFCYKKNLYKLKELRSWLLLLLVCSLLMTSISYPIWITSKTLQMVQFPWRIMGIFSFGIAALYGILIKKITIGNFRSKIKIFTSLVIIIMFLSQIWIFYQQTYSVAAIHNPNKGWNKYVSYVQTALNDPYTDKLWDVPEYRPLLKDNLPVPVPLIGQSRASVLSGQASVQINNWASYQRQLHILTETSSIIRIRTYYYPAWHLYVNNHPHPIHMSNDGTIMFNLEKGSYNVQLVYQWTSAFKIGVILSILSISILILCWLKITAKTRFSKLR